MKLSKIFTKTNKNPQVYESKNATLLTKAGYVDQTMAGVYTFLPLGLRVLAKIEAIVREEMDKIGVEVLMPSLVPKQLWETTGRINTVDVLFGVSGANKLSQLKNSAEYILSSTHEEVVTPLSSKFNVSYRDFPVAVYQIQTKFRNEPRAKSGLLRCREFRMKDLYSFHTSEADLKRYYEEAKHAYTEVFRRLGLGDDTLIALASGGDFTRDYSHEFQTRCDTGEDTIFYAKKSGIAYNREVAPSKAPPVSYPEEAPKPREDVLGEGVIGVEDIAGFLKIPVEQTTKTLLFESDEGKPIIAAVRGGYDINQEKLSKAAGVKSVMLASADKVREVFGAEAGYVGIVNIPEGVPVYMDESVAGRVNFETGTNRTNYHAANVNFGRDLPEPERYYDIKTAKDGDLYPETGEKYEVFAASEVGNIFPLNTKFTKAFGYTYTDQQGNRQPIYMGCYGIGTSRVVGVIAEKFSDDKGLVWPVAIAPYRVHLVSLPGGEKQAEELYTMLMKTGIEVLWDDRDVSAGAKLADADLIGIPVRLVVSKKTGDKVEFKLRTEAASQLLTADEVTERIR
jgi:prolyl-tRNA synthetase